jgi:hypothetical protein
MHRNRELIRQWTLLQKVAAGRGSTIPTLAKDLAVSTRTIRRDLAALQEAGFPVYDDTINGTKFWRVEAKSLGTLARSGLTFSELCALYFSRALIECFAGTHLLADVQSALKKFESALTPRMKKFLDRLPGVVTATPRGAKRHDAGTYQVIARLLEAILHQRVWTCDTTPRKVAPRRTTSCILSVWFTPREDCTCGHSCPSTGNSEHSPSSACVALRSRNRRSRRSPSLTQTRSSTRWARTAARPPGSRSDFIRASRHSSRNARGIPRNG